jgi:hypothetical protein
MCDGVCFSELNVPERQTAIETVRRYDEISGKDAKETAPHEVAEELDEWGQQALLTCDNTPARAHVARSYHNTRPAHR